MNKSKSFKDEAKNNEQAENPHKMQRKKKITKKRDNNKWTN